MSVTSQVTSYSSLSICSLKSSVDLGPNFSPQKLWDQCSLSCRVVIGENVRVPHTVLSTHSIGIPKSNHYWYLCGTCLKEADCRRPAKDSSREQCEGLWATLSVLKHQKGITELMKTDSCSLGTRMAFILVSELSTLHVMVPSAITFRKSQAW